MKVTSKAKTAKTKYNIIGMSEKQAIILTVLLRQTENMCTDRIWNALVDAIPRGAASGFKATHNGGTYVTGLRVDPR